VDCRFIPHNKTWRRWVGQASIELNNVDFVNNSAVGCGATGGAIALTNGNAVLTLVSFTNNSAQVLGGALYLPRGQFLEATTVLTLSSTTFEGNEVIDGKGSSFYSESAGALTRLWYLAHRIGRHRHRARSKLMAAAT
jgi:hypothetical protein